MLAKSRQASRDRSQRKKKYVHSSPTRRNDEDHAAAPLGSRALQTPTSIAQYARWKAREGPGGLGSSGVGIARCRCRACCSDTRFFAGKPCEFQVPSVGAAEGLTPNQRAGSGPGASTCATLPQRRHTGCPKRGHWETKLRERQPMYREDRQCTVSRPETRMGQADLRHAWDKQTSGGRTGDHSVSAP